MMANQKEWLDLYLLNSIITKIAITAAKVSTMGKITMLLIRIILINKRIASKRRL